MIIADLEANKEIDGSDVGNKQPTITNKTLYSMVIT